VKTLGRTKGDIQGGGGRTQRVDKEGEGEELKQEIEGSCHNQASRYFCSGKFCAR